MIIIILAFLRDVILKLRKIGNEAYHLIFLQGKQTSNFSNRACIIKRKFSTSDTSRMQMIIDISLY